MKIDTNTTIGELQEYVRVMNKERGFTGDASVKFMKLVEEVGELSKVIGTTVGMKSDVTTDISDLEQEMADVLLVLFGLAAILNVDMAEAVAAKEVKNQGRSWK